MGIRRVLAGTVLGLAGSALLALPAAAVPGDPYGPQPSGGGLSVSDSNATVGETITVAGSGFAPNSDVTISSTVVNQGFGQVSADAAAAPLRALAPAGRAAVPVQRLAAATCTLGQTCTVTADANGNFTASILLTQAGTVVITATGVDPAGNQRVLTATIFVAGGAGAGGAGTGGTGTGGGSAGSVGGGDVGLPNTGSDLKTPVLLGSVLVLLGGGAAVLGRRRRRGASTAG
jgi:LPXTG-motif cell wall-anchored protein